MLKLFAVILFTCKTMYNKTIIRFGFCDIRNNQGLGKCQGRTIRNSRRGGDFYQKKIPARETCLKKILQVIMPKKKIRATEVTYIALKGNAKKNKLKAEYCNTLHFITTTAV